MTKYLRDPIIWMFFIVGLAIVSTPINLRREVGTPFIGVISELSISDRHWKVETATPPWWDGVSSDKLLPLDFLLKINGQEYGVNTNKILQEAKERGDTSVTLEIERGSILLKKQIPIEYVKLDDFLDLAVPNFINSFCYWIVAFGIYLLRPKDYLNRVFALTCCVIAASQSLTQPSTLVFSNYYSWTANFLWALISPFVGATIFHFSTVFPVERSTPKWFLKLLYGVAGIVGVAFASARVFFAKDGFSNFSAFLDLWGYQTSMILLFAGWVTLIFNMYCKRGDS